MNFCEKLKALRTQHEMRQSELAARSGLTANKVQRYEQSNQKPKGDDALALARALGVSADYLLDDELPFPPPETFLSEKVVLVRRLEDLIGSLLRDGKSAVQEKLLPDVTRLPVYKLGAGFDIAFDVAGQPQGQKVRDMYFSKMGEGRFFAAEMHGSSMRGAGEAGFSLGEVLLFKQVEYSDVAPGEYVYVRFGEREQGASQGIFRQAFGHGDALRLRALNPADPEVIVDRHQVEQTWRLVLRMKEY